MSKERHFEVKALLREALKKHIYKSNGVNVGCKCGWIYTGDINKNRQRIELWRRHASSAMAQMLREDAA